jgi:hypothetical protein
MVPNIGFGEMLIVGVLCCLPIAISAGLALVLVRMRKKPNS